MKIIIQIIKKVVPSSSTATIESLPAGKQKQLQQQDELEKEDNSHKGEIRHSKSIEQQELDIGHLKPEVHSGIRSDSLF